MKTAVVIPARLDSTRLPRKLLLNETGKPLIQHTYDAALTSEFADEVIVAVDDQELGDAIESFGGRWMMTSKDHRSGTDRVAEVAAKLDAEIIVNLQGDEPEIRGDAIDLIIQLLLEQPDAVIATLATPIRDLARLNDPSCVKVVLDHQGRAMYFSRSPIPYARDGFEAPLVDPTPIFLQHIGLYGYRRCFLKQLSELAPASIERIESLEQLRFLHAGFGIWVKQIEHETRGIDTLEDYRAFVKKRSK